MAVDRYRPFGQGRGVACDRRSLLNLPDLQKKEDDALQSAEVAVTEITVAEMSAHKIGQVVNYSPRLKVGAGVYQIAQLMPPAGDVPQYRIKSEAEGHLRAAMESELSPLNAADMATRRFPPPWRAAKIPGGYVVRDARTSTPGTTRPTRCRPC